MQAASLALRTDKSPVAVAKVDLVFVSSMVQYILVYHHEYIFSLKKKKKSLMQTVEKFSLKLAVKNKDSCLSLCTPLCFSHPVLL